jgi:hypothetical protein
MARCFGGMTMIDAAKLLEGTTPGPWRFRDGSDRCLGFWVDAPGDIVRNDRGPSYAQQIIGDEEYDRKEADCRLIAAAPDLARRVIELETENARLKAKGDALAEALQDALDGVGALTNPSEFPNILGISTETGARYVAALAQWGEP